MQYLFLGTALPSLQYLNELTLKELLLSILVIANKSQYQYCNPYTVTDELDKLGLSWAKLSSATH